MKRINLPLTIFLAAQVAISPGAFASPGSAGLTLAEKLGNFVRRYLPGSQKKLKHKAEKFEVDLDESPGDGRDNRVTVDGAPRRGKRTGAQALKDVNAIEYTPEFLASKPPYVGRFVEIRNAIASLIKNRLPNAYLIAPSGAGKTSMMYEIARYLNTAARQLGLPEPFVVEIQISNIVAGTTFRGDIEERMKDVWAGLKEMAKTRFVVLGLDEIHQVVGAGRTSEGSNSLAELLKPLLSEEDLKGAGIHVLSATTVKEDRLYVRPNEAFRRRLGMVIEFGAPDLDQATGMVMAYIPHLEAFHGVTFSRSQIDFMVKMAHEHVKDMVLPGPALDMMDAAAAHFRLDNIEPAQLTKMRSELTSLADNLKTAETLKTPAGETRASGIRQSIEELRGRMSQVEQAWNRDRSELLAANENVRRLEVELSQTEKLHLDSVLKTEAHDRASRKKNAELVEKIEDLKKRLTSAHAEQKRVYEARRSSLPEVPREHVIQAVSQVTHLDPAVIGRNLEETKTLLERTLPQAVPGQRVPMTKVGQALKPGVRGLRMSRPRGVITLFDSSGRTRMSGQAPDMVKAIDELVQGGKNGRQVRDDHMATFIIDFADPSSARFDLSELMERLTRRPHQTIGFLNTQQADSTTLQNLVTAITTGRVPTGVRGDPAQAFMDFSDTILVVHWGRADDIAEELINASDRRPVIDALTRHGENDTVRENLLNAVTTITNYSDALVSLRKPGLTAKTRIVQRRLEDLNKLLRETLSLPRGFITIEPTRRAAIKLASQSDSIEDVDLILEREVLGRLNQLIDQEQIHGGEILRLEWIPIENAPNGGNFGLLIPDGQTR